MKKVKLPLIKEEQTLWQIHYLTQYHNTLYLCRYNLFAQSGKGFPEFISFARDTKYSPSYICSSYQNSGRI